MRDLQASLRSYEKELVLHKPTTVYFFSDLSQSDHQPAFPTGEEDSRPVRGRARLQHVHVEDREVLRAHCRGAPDGGAGPGAALQAATLAQGVQEEGRTAEEGVGGVDPEVQFTMWRIVSDLIIHVLQDSRGSEEGACRNQDKDEPRNHKSNTNTELYKFGNRYALKYLVPLF